MRHGPRFLIGPLVGAAAVAIALTGCGSSGSDADPAVASPPTTAEVPSTSEVVETTTTAPASGPTSTSETVQTTTTTVADPAAVTAAPITVPKPTSASSTSSVPGMSAQELAALEAELVAIDAILTELNQNLAAD